MKQGDKPCECLLEALLGVGIALAKGLGERMVLVCFLKGQCGWNEVPVGEGSTGLKSG